LQASLDRLPRGASSVTDLSEWIEDAVERAWVYGSLMFGDTQVRTGYLIVGMLKTTRLKSALLSISKQFDRIKIEDLTDNFARLLASSPEQGQRASDGSGDAGEPGEASGAIAPAAMGKQEALKRFTVDLTERARSGEIDPVAGRDEEIRQIVDILMRRRQNNPILTGEAGVGKTAVVEGFAVRLARGDVPPQLKDVSLYVLDIGLLQAGASMKGEFENRLRSVIDEVQASPKPIILFIDEAHTLIGAGGAAGTGDAANLLKPGARARQAAHDRRDDVGRVQEAHREGPGADAALPGRPGGRAERGEGGADAARRRLDPREASPGRPARRSDHGGGSPLAPLHPGAPAARQGGEPARHRVRARRRQPARDAAELEDCQRRLEALRTEGEIIGREEAIGIDVGEPAQAHDRAIDDGRDAPGDAAEASRGRKGCRRPHPRDPREAARARRRCLPRPRQARRRRQPRTPRAGPPARCCGRFRRSRRRRRGRRGARSGADPGLSEADRKALLAELAPLQKKLAELQGDAPLILPTVDEQAIASVVQDWTGVPVGRMVKNEIESVLKLADTLNQRVIGQKHALDIIAKRIQTSRARLDNPNKPIGVFMLCGTSGVGKTETALALAEALYGGEQNVITINMSEFQEAHTVSTLKGSPPGYVGYGEAAC
jgi:type VI secretion system protein VasG